jgi:hypothetical protein
MHISDSRSRTLKLFVKRVIAHRSFARNGSGRSSRPQWKGLRASP